MSKGRSKNQGGETVQCSAIKELSTRWCEGHGENGKKSNWKAWRGQMAEGKRKKKKKPKLVQAEFKMNSSGLY